MKLETQKYMPNRRFSSPKAEELFGKTPLPEMPPCPQCDQYEIVRPKGPSYVMSTEEEIQRFLEYNYAKLRLNRELEIVNRDGVGPQAGYNKREARKRAKRWLSRADHLREYLTRINMPLIYSLVARMGPRRFPHLDWNEAVSEGHLPLLNALNKFEVKRGYKFSTYACRAIINTLSRCNAAAGRKKHRVASVELPELYGQIPEPGQGRDQREMADVLLGLLRADKSGLDQNESLTIRHRYGIGGGDRLTLEAVGDIIGVTKERVRQIQMKAEGKLRKALELAL